MKSLHRLLRDYTDSGALNSLIQVWGFVDDQVFITKAGEIGMVCRLHGVDYEGCDHGKRQDIVHRYETALRLLDEEYRVYQYLIKKRIDPFPPIDCHHPVAAEAIQRQVDFLNGQRDRLYTLDVYLVIMTEGLAPRKAWWSPSSATTVLETELLRHVERLHHKVRSVVVQLSDSVRPDILDHAAAFQFFRQLVNYAPSKHVPHAVPDVHLDYFMVDSALTCHRDHLEVDQYYVKVLSMKEPPSHTFAHMLEDWYNIPCEFISCLEWRRIPSERMRRDVKSRRRHFFNQRTSLRSEAFSTEAVPESAKLVDTSADVTVHQLGDAMAQIEVHGHVFGECSLTMVLYDLNARTVEHAAAETMKVLATHDGACVEETYNILNAWLGVLPGNHQYNLRRLAILDSNVADLSFLFTLDKGAATEAWATFETTTCTPYALSLRDGDVGHTLITGMTGGGKSFAVNYLMTQAQRFHPMTVIFDIGHDYRKLATLFGGSYLEVGANNSGVHLNPFTLEPTSENLNFLHRWVKVLLGEVTPPQDVEVYEAIVNLYVIDPSQRRLFTLANMLPRALTQRLSKWIGSGQYGGVFDDPSADDTLSVQRFQVFEFEAMLDFPDLMDPLLFYILHRVNAQIGTGLTLCVMDEAWKFITHPLLREYVREALKTWRKKNASMILSTQSIEDFKSQELLRTVIESCPTKLFLVNPDFNRARYAELFQLSEMDIELLAGLTPRQLLLKRPSVTKVLLLNVDPKSYWIYTNSPADNARLDGAVAAMGLEQALTFLARG